ncbi:putative polysaccharide biosynthesis protein [Oceanirhabdus seepicola]|uniref:putative polysaccharide biosynthesis protein n=1 Tax=Oceanirhabdus seepicola TaxID=2828781 RepID=UPI0020323154|nr:polysaccharide biosynthesis protein [Oceanirhabdus seepicola]
MNDNRIRKNSMVSGALILGVCMIFARFLGVFFRIPLQNLIKDEGMGYYQMSYPIYMTFVAIASGIPIALSKMVSEYNAEGKLEHIRVCVRSTLYIMLVFAASTSLVLLLFSKRIVLLFGWHEKSYYAFLITAIAPIFVVILGTFRGFFQGIRNMAPSGVSQIIEQLGRVMLGVGIAYMLFPKGVEYSAAGAVIGTVIGAAIAGVYLLIKYYQVIKVFPKSNMNNQKNIMRKIISIAIPISIVTTMGSLMVLFDNMIVPKRLINAGFSKMQITIIFGQTYGKAATLNNVPLALSMAICASIVPVIAEAKLRNFELFKSKVQLAIKLAIVIALPSAAGLYFMAFPIMDMVFVGSTGGYEILKLFAISLPFIVICQATTSIFNAIGKYHVPIINLGIGCIIKVSLTYFLVGIPYVNIKGALLGTIFGYAFAGIMNIIYIKRRLKVEISNYEILFKPIIATMIMIISVVFAYTNVYNYTRSNTFSCITAIFIGALCYSIMVFGLRIFDFDEIKIRFNRKSKR